MCSTGVLVDEDVHLEEEPEPFDSPQYEPVLPYYDDCGAIVRFCFPAPMQTLCAEPIAAATEV